MTTRSASCRSTGARRANTNPCLTPGAGLGRRRAQPLHVPDLRHVGDERAGLQRGRRPAMRATRPGITPTTTPQRPAPAPPPPPGGSTSRPPTPTGRRTPRRTRSSSRAPSTPCTRPRESPTSASTPARASGTTSSANYTPVGPVLDGRLPALAERTGLLRRLLELGGQGRPAARPAADRPVHSGPVTGSRGLRRRLRLLAPSRRFRASSAHGRALRVAGTLRQRGRQRPPRGGVRAPRARHRLARPGRASQPGLGLRVRRGAPGRLRQRGLGRRGARLRHRHAGGAHPPAHRDRTAGCWRWPNGEPVGRVRMAPRRLRGRAARLLSRRVWLHAHPGRLIALR